MAGLVIQIHQIHHYVILYTDVNTDVNVYKFIMASYSWSHFWPCHLEVVARLSPRLKKLRGTQLREKILQSLAKAQEQWILEAGL